MKQLVDLNPKWTGVLRPNSGEGIELDCPTCGAAHRLVAYFSNPLDGEPPASWQVTAWTREGDAFDSLTVRPSIQYPCFHGWIERGRVFNVSESPVVVPDRRGMLVSLSPEQALEFANRVIAKCEDLLT